MSFLEDWKALTREKRISTLSHYNGTYATLKNDTKGAEIKQRIRTFTQSSQDEVIYAISVLSRIKKAAIIVHGTVGCSASGIYFKEDTGKNWYSTNFTERDTILGGEEKLRKAVVRAYDEENPDAIFIVGTPVIAINNDDTNAVILELKEELNIPIIFIHTDGFKTKSPATGYDIVLHALLRYIVERNEAEEKEDFINVVSLSDNREDVHAVTEILRDLDLNFQVLPQFSDIAGIQKASRAKATIVLNPDEGGYFASELEEVFGVPYIHTDPPIGLQGTRNFIRKIGKALGIEEKAAEYIEDKEYLVQREIQKEILAGKTVFLDIDLACAFYFINFIEKLKGTVKGIAFFDVDLNNRNQIEKLDALSNATPVVVANGQPFEKANILSKNSFDYYIGKQEDLAFAAQQGSIPVSLKNIASLGYEGVLQFVRQIEKAEAASQVTKLLYQQEDAFYKKAWLTKSSNWYVKQEVK